MANQVIKTDEEWRRELTPEQYQVCRLKGTERPFTGKYYASKEDGIYRCSCCSAELFSSEAKFDSGTGWPSFYQPINPGSVEMEVGTSYGLKWIEVHCHRCGAHLGHVFDDGPLPTGLRYCLNSICLDLEKGRAE